MAAGDLFKRAAKYRKQHPGMSMPEAVKACSKSGKKKAAAKKKPAARKKAAKKVGKVKPRKIKVKIKTRKAGNTISIGKAKKRPAKKKSGGILKALGISGVSMSKINQELEHQRSLVSALERELANLKAKGLKALEKNKIRRDISHYRNAITASKKHVNALKRSI